MKELVGVMHGSGKPEDPLIFPVTISITDKPPFVATVTFFKPDSHYPFPPPPCLEIGTGDLEYTELEELIFELTYLYGFTPSK